MIKFVYDTQMVVEGSGVKIDEIKNHLSKTPKGDCLLVVGEDGFARIHFHTNEPWEVLKWVASVGKVSDIIIENMQLQCKEFKK